MTPTATRRAIFTTMLMGLAIVVSLLLSQGAHTAARSRPKHSVYVTRDLTAYANLTKRWSPCDWDAVARSVQTKPVNELTTYCEKALAKGRALFCMLRNSQLNPGYATRWTDTNALRQYGYELEVTRNYDVSQFAKEFAALGIPLTGWTLLDYSHTADGNVGGTTYPATGAFFHNAINERAGALIAEHNINPDGENALRVARGERPISPVPDLKQWSDITYLGLKLFSPSAPSSIRHVFHDNIINRETKVLFGYVIDQEHLDDTNEVGDGYFPFRLDAC